MFVVPDASKEGIWSLKAEPAKELEIETHGRWHGYRKCGEVWHFKFVKRYFSPLVQTILSNKNISPVYLEENMLKLNCISLLIYSSTVWDFIYKNLTFKKFRFFFSFDLLWSFLFSCVISWLALLLLNTLQKCAAALFENVILILNLFYLYANFTNIHGTEIVLC